MSMWEVLKLNAPEKWLILLGIVGAIISGAAFPLFALAFGEVFLIFLQPISEVLRDLHMWGAIFLVMAFCSGLGEFIKVSLSAVQKRE